VGVRNGSSCCAVCRRFLPAAMKTMSDKRVRDLNLVWLALERVPSATYQQGYTFRLSTAASAGPPLAPGPLAFPDDSRSVLEGPSQRHPRPRFPVTVSCS
jgi:hypothetical protein